MSKQSINGDSAQRIADAAIAWFNAAHVYNANCSAGDCDECPARVMKARLRVVIAKELGAEPDRHDARVAEETIL